MAFSFNDRRVASEVRAALPDHVDTAKKQSAKEEHQLVEAAAQVIHFAIKDVDDDHLVEINASGSSTPSTGESYLNITAQVRAIRSKPVAAEPVKRWTPDQGPLVARSESFPMIEPGPNADLVQPDGSSGTSDTSSTASSDTGSGSPTN